MKGKILYVFAICVMLGVLLFFVVLFASFDHLSEEDYVGASEAEELMETGYIWSQPEESPVTEPAVMATEPAADTETETESTEFEVGFLFITEAMTEEETVQLETASETEWFMNDETECQLSYDITGQEAEMLQKLAWAEAGGEGVEAMALVMRVVINRTLDPKFPNNIPDVIMAPGQFTPLLNGSYATAQPNAQTQEALQLVMSGWDESHGATYFATERSQWHKNNLQYLFNEGPICFYTYWH